MYCNGLHDLLEMLAAHPRQGRSAEELARGLRRMPYQSHVVFYKAGRHGVRIVRVLHQRMDIERHL
jgi:toxin ParE1/3/4